MVPGFFLSNQNISSQLSVKFETSKKSIFCTNNTNFVEEMLNDGSLFFTYKAFGQKKPRKNRNKPAILPVLSDDWQFVR